MVLAVICIYAYIRMNIIRTYEVGKINRTYNNVIVSWDNNINNIIRALSNLKISSYTTFGPYR